MSYNGWSRDLIAALFPGKDYSSKIPADATAEAVIDGVLYRVLTTAEARARIGTSGMAMRVLAKCPHCYKVVAATRLRQHLPVHLYAFVFKKEPAPTTSHTGGEHEFRS